MMTMMLMMIQEYLEYQRQMALQRMQEQEMEMRRRLEQQKQEQHMRAMQYTYPQVLQPHDIAHWLVISHRFFIVFNKSMTE